MHMVLRGEEFLWTREGADIYKIIYKHEIPPAFWHLSISDYIAYFDHGIKPILSYRRPE